ncbi:hypothetical protein H2C43_04845 [Corynebacterium glutamicum]|nr:hypothetical protein [Corynebacterium glutamicum]CCH24847.1 hypothetical protein WA5_1627 [Corynebacterium glutamicum K051]ARV66245.1 hypothetical protein B7P23_04385 [Corynebacterium glutamicum]AUI02546.1 hypothetical protein CYL77_08595 [Corynebacterium glutamicum]AUI05605.1 hypothetical protein C0I99_12295 [Corynebacterium glutamicum]MBA4570278.1 hypothetical protein [Corynebacterium glutamicum]
MRTIWQRDSANDQEPWSEIRRYSPANGKLPRLPEQLPQENSSIYWGQSEDFTFKIGTLIDESFWSGINKKAISMTDDDKSKLILNYSEKAISAFSEFSTSAHCRYLPVFAQYIHHLPRDLRELKELLLDSHVRCVFEDANLSVSSIFKDIQSFEDYSKKSHRIVHGCFRFRNIGFSGNGKLLVISGDDLIYGSEIFIQAAMLADLFELSSSKVVAVNKSMFVMYQTFTQNKDSFYVNKLNRFTFLYLISHYVQFLFTYKKSFPKRLLSEATLLRFNGPVI